MAEEIWKPIPGYEGFYEASSAGRIRSLNRVQEMNGRWGPITRKVKGKLIALNESRSGYISVRICKDGRHLQTSAHVLVCAAFNGPKPTMGHQVAHIDGDRQNNTPANLRWSTQSENEADKVAHGRFPRGEERGHAKLNEEAVRHIRKSGRSLLELARKYGVSHSVIGEVRRGETWTHVI